MNNKNKSHAWGVATIVLILTGAFAGWSTMEIYGSHSSGFVDLAESYLWALFTGGIPFFIIAFFTFQLAMHYRYKKVKRTHENSSK